MAAHSSILAWEIPNLVGYSPWSRKTEHSTSLNLEVIFFNVYLIIFDCAESSTLHRFSLAAVSGGYAPLRYIGLSLQ